MAVVLNKLHVSCVGSACISLAAATQFVEYLRNLSQVAKYLRRLSRRKDLEAW